MKFQMVSAKIWQKIPSKLSTAVGAFALAFLLSQNGTAAAPTCSTLFTEIDAAKTSSLLGAQFIHSRDSKLHTTSFVEKIAAQHKRVQGTSLSKPADKISNWLDYLERVAHKAAASPRTETQIKTVLYKQYIITEKNVPQSYYDLQARIARERGHGDIQISASQKASLAETLIKDQQRSLDSWTEYLISKDTAVYPMWLKHWMFTGMTKLSKYDPATGSFGNRSSETVAPFPELNREALAFVADAALKKINKQSLEQIQDPSFLKALEGMNFGKLYGQTLLKLGHGQNGKFSTNQGRWVLYPQGSDHLPLVRSLEGKNTGWCTAGEFTAKSQIQEGDFHVYYSLDAAGQPTIPRVAIRMSGENIAEVRGVSENQNLDSQINSSQIVSGKLKEFGSKADTFNKKDHDMRLLTSLDNKAQLGQALSKEELLFLYEVERPIEGFGYSVDPRIRQILDKRNSREDVAFMLFDNKYSAEDIAISQTEFFTYGANFKVLYGDLISDKESFTKMPEVIFGNLELQELRSWGSLKIPKVIKGNMDFYKLDSVEGLNLPEVMNGRLSLPKITSTKGLRLPRVMNGDLHLDGLSEAQGLILPEVMNGGLGLMGLQSAQGLKLPRVINGHLSLKRLKSADHLKLPDRVSMDLDLSGLTSIKGLVLPKELGGGLSLSGLTSAEGLQLPARINGELHLKGLIQARGVKFPEFVEHSLFLNNLTSAHGLVLPKEVGSLELSALKSAEGLVLPETVRGWLNLSDLPSAKTLLLPKKTRSYFGPNDIQQRPETQN